MCIKTYYTGDTTNTVPSTYRYPNGIHTIDTIDSFAQHKLANAKEKLSRWHPARGGFCIMARETKDSNCFGCDVVKYDEYSKKAQNILRMRRYHSVHICHISAYKWHPKFLLHQVDKRHHQFKSVPKVACLINAGKCRLYSVCIP